MRSKVNFGHSKWPTAAILSKKFKKKRKVVYRSEIARYSIESEFWTSKLADGSQFVKNFKKKKKLRIDLKWPEIQSKVNFGHPKWPTAAILSKISKEIKVAYRSQLARNVIKNEFRSSKMSDGGHFIKNFKKKFCIHQKCDWKWFSDIQNGRRQPFCKKLQKKIPHWSKMSRNVIES